MSIIKRIGILLREFTSASGNALNGFRGDLLHYLRQYPVEVVSIPIDYDNDENQEFLAVLPLIKRCDGIILPGGSKIHAIDKRFVLFLYEQNLPVLGLCLGMQTMAVTFDGVLATLSSNDHQSKLDYVHPVLLEESLLSSILKSKRILVNSRHNEFVKKTKLDCVAYSIDGIPEAVEAKNKTFFIGVQWHPESLIHDSYSKLLFDAFIESLDK